MIFDDPDNTVVSFLSKLVYFSCGESSINAMQLDIGKICGSKNYGYTIKCIDF
jgi:hypothetical protein